MPDEVHFRLYRSKTTKQWRWRMVAANGEIIAHGESYKRKIDAERVITLIKVSSPFAPVREGK